MDIGLMVEGQNGLTWERWRHILQLAERLGFPTLFRSDHYFIGRQQSSIDAFLSFAVAALETSRIRFGPLVTPVTFRSPVDVGRMAAQLHGLSGGRFTLGVGAGWNEPEHRAYGIVFPPVKERMDRLEEGIHVIKALWAEGPQSYQGQYYHLDQADCLPKPAGHLPLVIGGMGELRTLKLVAEHADEWSSVNLTPDRFAEKSVVLAKHCAAAGRDPASIRKSMMLFGFVGPDDRTVEGLLRRFYNDDGATTAALHARAAERRMFAGTTQQLLDYLGALATRGMHEVQLQHLEFSDDSLPEYLAAEVAPWLRG
jgi:F420-dependent oxidoreductase-like protein